MSRQDRLKAALRDNLKRRKDQVRGRAETTGEAPEPDCGERSEAAKTSAKRDTP